MKQEMNGGEAVCAALEALGVDHVFGVPSQQNLALYEALSHSNSIRVIGARHEAGAVHAADGYARATGKLGVAIVSTGPGTANAMNGLYEAGFASSPVLLITTQINRCWLRREKGAIHDASNQLAMLKTVTRRADQVRYAHEIVPTMIALARDILTGRPQPGAIEIPSDVLDELCPADRPAMAAVPRIMPQESAIAKAAELLAKARRPLLWLGGGCVRGGAEEAVRALVDHLGAPVVTTPNGRSAIATDHPLVVGSGTQYPPFRRLLEEADLVLAVGTRFQAVPSGFWSLPLGKQLIQIDADPEMIGRNYPAAVGIVGDAEEALVALRQACAPGQVDPGYSDLARNVAADLLADSAERIGVDHVALCDALDRALPADRNIVCDATMVGNSWGSYRLPVRTFRGFTYSTSLAIGPALPLAIGMALGTGRRTIAVHGDGGVMLNLGELATAVEMKAPVTLLIFNSNGYQILKTLQQMNKVSVFGVDLHTPDFVTIGQGMGMPAERVDNPRDFEAAVARSVAVEGPSLIEIDMKNMAPLGL
ncbi:thiamine pyrophosphate-binding protein [Sphingobium estronivorans]|uniref:thiamine pyrophosphate-binding protein n=1 Tax=Sphingobium estronivorans TaxID=1577690 RepID=UPI00123B4748|nr:thiamine pyrophosphate-binding protein [Sphingobium estronivorans]